MAVTFVANMISFEKWKERLRDDCIVMGKEEEFDRLGDVFLQILYANHTDPNVAAIVGDGLNGQPTKRATRP
jgi:hypothetical protein